jgi:GT2 family glycosyltransferase
MSPVHKYDICVSIVVNNTDESALRKTLESVGNCRLNYKLYVIDNSPAKRIDRLLDDPRIEYIFNNGNLGFGRAHNIALKKSVQESHYHLVLNPDVFFPANTLETIYQFMERNPEAGLVLPKVCNEKGEVQYLAKRLPNPLDLVVRRINSRWLSFMFRHQLSRYEMRDRDYNQTFTAPFLSGCFMFVRTQTLCRIGFFDERFFLYMEDVDLSRRILSVNKNVFFPEVMVYHKHSRGSYRATNLFLRHIQSAIKYFNKWGWLYDQERERINRGVY